MELSLTEAQEATLNEIADHNGKSVSDLLVQAAASLVQAEEKHWAANRSGFGTGRS